MKVTVFLLLCLMLFFIYSDIAMAALSTECSGYPRNFCTMDYTPHCGVLHHTYRNKCDFCNAFVKSGGVLQLEYRGVCSKDRKDVAMKELPINCSGHSREACSKENKPLCGSTRHTYSNKCEFCNAFVEKGENLQLDYYGRCSQGVKE